MVTIICCVFFVLWTRVTTTATTMVAVASFMDIFFFTVTHLVNAQQRSDSLSHHFCKIQYSLILHSGNKNTPTEKEIYTKNINLKT